MALQAEFLIPSNIRNGDGLLRSLAAAAQQHGDRPVMRSTLQGRSPWLVLYGVGAPGQAEARRRQTERNCHTVHWDAAYFSRGRKIGYFRVSVDSDHPQQWLDATPDDCSRWSVHETPIREDADPRGPILLVGLGKKSRIYLKAEHWEVRKLAELRHRFPGRKIIYRPKPKHPHPVLAGIDTDATTPIEKLLVGCSRVVCRHSNVAVDAVVAGVPIEVEDGAAQWLDGKPYTVENRLSFLHRLAWWQWRADEAMQAWAFLRKIVV